jgi:hypothetical protein
MKGEGGHGIDLLRALAYCVSELRPPDTEKLLKKCLELINNALLFLSTSAAKAGNGRHQAINIRAGGLDFTVAGSIFKEFARFRLFEVFLLNKRDQFFFAFGGHEVIPFIQNIVNVVDSGDKRIDELLFAAQFGAGIDGFLNGNQNLRMSRAVSPFSCDVYGFW